jgi:dienelactone hydrolase
MKARPAITALAILVLGSAATRLPARPIASRPEHEVTAQDLVYQVPGMDRVTVQKDIPYKHTDSGERKLDLYYPADFRHGSERPAVVFINGVGDQPNSRLKEWEPYRSWGRLVAASGWIAVTFEAGGPDTRADIRDLFRYVRSEGAKLGIDANRVAAWVCSGNVTPGLPFLMEDADPGVVCAVVYYGVGSPGRLRTDLPVLFVRAGKDNRRLNEGIDRLSVQAVAAGAPWTLVNAPESHHAFDVLDETEESRRIVRQTLEYFREFLSPHPRPASASAARKALAHWFGHEYPEAAAAYGDYVRTHPDDAVAFLRLGLSQAHAGKASEAEANMQKAVSLGADRAIDLYNVACGYALLGRTEKALDELERAVAAGFNNKSLLANDTDLASLRGTPRFEKLLEGLR